MNNNMIPSEMPKTKPYQIPEALLDCIPGYLERRDIDMKELGDYIQRQDFESIGRVAHKLIGCGSGYGFDRITDLGRLLWDSAKSQDLAKTVVLVSSLQREIANIKGCVL